MFPEFPLGLQLLFEELEERDALSHYWDYYNCLSPIFHPCLVYVLAIYCLQKVKYAIFQIWVMQFSPNWMAQQFPKRSGDAIIFKANPATVP